MKQKLQTLLFALVAIMMPIGVWAEQAQWGTSKEVITGNGTLAEAFAAAAEGGIGYIQLQSDIANDNGYSISGGKFTLDLNGYKLVSSSNPLVIEGECNVTITDGSENKTGMMSSISSDCYAIALNDDYGVLTINGGKYEVVNTCVVEIHGGSLTITGGEFAVTSDAEQIIANNEHGTLSITGGTFDAKHTNYALSSLGTTTVSGGTFKNARGADVFYHCGSLTFDNDPRGVSIRCWAEEYEIILPEGYGFYDANDEAVTDFQNDWKCYIGKTEGAAYTVTFSANYDTEATPEETTEETVESPTGRYTLPECDFNAPEGMMFKAWLVGEEEYQPEDEIVVTADTEIKAVWTEFVSQIVIYMSDYYGDSWDGASITVMEDGKELEMVSVEEGYTNTTTITYDPTCEYTFYWTKGECDSECSFKIRVNGKKVSEALQYVSESGIASDCSDFEDGECFFTLEATAIAEAKWGTSAYALTSYGTLDDAIAAAREENSTVGYIQLKSDVTSESGYSVYGGTFTLDLNGKTLTSEGFTLTFYGGAVTITDGSENKTGKVITTAEGCATVDVYDGSTVSIDGGWYESVNHPAVKIGELANVTINGGEFYINDFNIELIDNSGTLTITGGTFHAENAYYAIYVGGNTTISDGTFVGAQTADVKYCGGTLTFEATEATDETPGFSPMGLSVDYQAEGEPSFSLPEGYDFYNSDDEAVTDFQYDYLYYIGKTGGAGFTVTFHGNNGTEETAEETVESPTGKYTLPECDFNAPEGMMFDGWQVGEEEYQPDDEIVVTEDTEVEAVWTEYVPQIVIKMKDLYYDGWTGASITVMEDGKELGTATVEEYFDTNTVTFTYDPTCEYTFYWTKGDYDEECSFKIRVNGKKVFEALQYESEDGTVSDCEDLTTEEPFFTLEIAEVTEIESLTIADGELTEYSAKLSHVGTLTYTRTLPNLVWNALYVPFEIPMSELLDNYDVAYFNNMHAYDRDVDGAIDEMEMEVIFIKEGTLHANHPYFIRAKSEAAKELTLELSDATLYSTAEERRTSITTSSAYMEFTLAGVYEQKTGEDGVYAINTKGAWSPIAEGAKLNPFRLFLQMTVRSGSPVKVDASAAKAFRIRALGDETTGIEHSEFRNQNSELVYDLMGRRVLEPQKGGIYIVDGKKVVW